MILFRADGNPKIGTGHIMRCLSIADAFAENGVKAVFAVADDSMKRLIEERGYAVQVLDTCYRNMIEDMDKTIALIHELDARAVIVDSYFVTAVYLIQLKAHARLVYIDDLLKFAYPADILVNYNIYAKRECYERLYSDAGMEVPGLLLGTKYAPLRREYRSVPQVRINKKCTDILISTGGADPVHLALEIIRHILVAPCENDFAYHLIIGAMNTDKAEIERLAKGRKNIVIHCNVRDMVSLICSCDIAVSAAGSTLYEICACGIPLIAYALADNQLTGLKAFEENRLAIYCGDLREAADAPEKLLTEVYKLAEDQKCREEMSERMRLLVDADGAKRIADFINCFGRD